MPYAGGLKDWILKCHSSIALAAVAKKIASLVLLMYIDVTVGEPYFLPSSDCGLQTEIFNVLFHSIVETETDIICSAVDKKTDTK